MKKFIITEEERSRILGMHTLRTKNHYLSEQPNDVSDLERKQFTDKMREEFLNEYYGDDFNECMASPFAKSEIEDNGEEAGKLYCLQNVYNNRMDFIDKELGEMGFPDGFHVPENISKDEFNELKTKWDNAL